MMYATGLVRSRDSVTRRFNLDARFIIVIQAVTASEHRYLRELLSTQSYPDERDCHGRQVFYRYHLWIFDPPPAGTRRFCS